MLFRTIKQGFSPLKLYNFRLYMSGQAVSLIGTWLQITAQSWVVWELTHSEAALGVVSMLGALPILLLGLWVGVLADRVNRRLLLIITQAGMMLLAFTLALLVQLKVVQLWHVYVLSTLLGIFSAIDFPTQQAFLGDLAGMSEVRKAVNLNAMFLQASRMVGPALAGWVIGNWGAATAFWINGVSFLAVIGSLLTVQAHQARGHNSGASVFSDLREGLRFLRGQPRIQDLLLLSICITFFALSLMNMMPAFAAEVLAGNAKTLGYLLASSGAGAFISTIFLLPVAQTRKRVGLLMGLAVIWAGLFFVLMSFFHWLPLAMGCLFATGLSLPLVIAMAMGLIQVLSPLQMRARLLSLFTMVSFGLQPLAAILIGVASESYGVARVMTINGSLLIITGLGMLALRKGLRDWQVQPGPAAMPAPAAVSH
jgi:MFS family permease